MVVILIVPPPPLDNAGLTGGGNSTRSASTTSVSFVSSDNGSPSYYTCCFLPQVDPDNVIATTKEEEWVTKKKVELTTKKQIETRVKRQVVLEDGRVVEDSGPIVTTNTTEDTEKQEHQQTEHRQLGDEKGDGENDKEVVVRISSLEGHPSLLKEVREKKINSREEKEELVETEDVVHLGNISDKAYQEAVQSKRDLREALEEANHKLVHVNSTGPRVVHQSSKNRKVTDTEDTRHKREVQKDGKIITETSKTTEHEEVNGADEPDSVPLPASMQQESLRESSHRYAKTKDQELVEYLADGRKIGERMRYEAVNEEADRLGDVDQQLRDMMVNAGELSGWDSLSERVRKMRDRQHQHQQQNQHQQPSAVAGKTLADFDEEERTRKVETAKWLEHHFGSESTRSSTGNLSDEDGGGAEDDRRERLQKSTSNSFINVTMKSTETTPPPVQQQPADGYFKGVSEWGKSRPGAADSPPVRPPVRRKRDQQKSMAAETVARDRNGGGELETSPLFNSVQRRVRGYEMTNEKLSGRTAAVTAGRHGQPQRNGHVQSDRAGGMTPNGRAGTNSPDADDRPWEDRRKRSGSSSAAAVPEPKPDYSPGPERRASNGSAAGGRAKKVYQKTRFAADAPGPQSASRQAAVDGKRHERKKSFGESFRRLVDKFTGGNRGGGGKSDADRKKNRKKSESERRADHDHYRDYGDDVGYDYDGGGDYDNDGGGGGGDDDDEHNTYRSYDGGVRRPTAADRNRRLFGSTQTLDRHRAGRINGTTGRVNDRPETATPVGNGGTMSNGGVHRYYLGEDPFGGSIYGREREYDGAAAYGHKRRQRNKDQEPQQHTTHYVQRIIPVNTTSTTLGRLSKSTGKLLADDYNSSVSDRAQTLPRKLKTENKIKKQVYTSSSRETDYGGLRNRSSAPNSGSMINVSFANGAAPPAKPQRTFSKPSLLLRSQSFNVQADVPASSRRSVGALHRLEESPPPLRSPNIVSSVSRSTKDLSAVLGGAVDDGYRSLSGSWAGASEQQQHQQQQQQHHHRPHDDPKKTVFMKGLLEHAPELYRTLGGGHQQQDHRVAQQQTTTRRGSNDDYTETVRFTSKSDDPYRPSVTDTVQNFTKKTVPRDGRLETIESTETKTVTKSRYQNGQQRPGNGGGVVIEVRNGRN